MKKKHKIILIVTSILLLLLLAAIVALTLLGRETPLTGFVTNVQSSQCKGLADKLLNVEKATYPFYRCEQEKYKVTNSDKSVTRVYVVAGAVERQWEFECGYNAPCQTYIGWFDENGKSFNFIEPPDTANHDPAIYTLGCGQKDSGSVYDISVKPELVFTRNKYWWKLDYNNTPTSTKGDSCDVSGTSLVGFNETLSSINAKYLFNTEHCDANKPSPCQTVKALRAHSIEPCKYDGSSFISGRARDSPPVYYYDGECTANYAAQTNNIALCNTEVNHLNVGCYYSVVVKRL